MDCEDDFETPDTTSTAASSSDAKAGGQAKAKAGRRKNTPPVFNTCLCCEAPRRARKKFCDKHVRSVEAMIYQAKRQGADAEKLMKALLEDDTKARQEVLEFSSSVPVAATWSAWTPSST